MKNKNVMIPFEVVERFGRRNGISLKDAVSINQDLLDYLDKAAESNESLSPSKLQDEAWHSFILHTQLYASFCENRYGYFIHHVPTGSNEDVFAVKVKAILQFQSNAKSSLPSACHGGSCTNTSDACGKHLCSSDCNPPSGQRSKLLASIDCYNSCSNDSCGASNCNSGGDAGH